MQARLWRPNGPWYGTRHAIWQSPSVQDKVWGHFSEKVSISVLTIFRAHRGALRGLRAGGHIPWLAYYFAVPTALGGSNATWVWWKPHASNWSVLYGIYGPSAVPNIGFQSNLSWTGCIWSQQKQCQECLRNKSSVGHWEPPGHLQDTPRHHQYACC